MGGPHFQFAHHQFAHHQRDSYRDHGFCSFVFWCAHCVVVDSPPLIHLRDFLVGLDFLAGGLAWVTRLGK